jgi:hypothetical protein
MAKRAVACAVSATLPGAGVAEVLLRKLPASFCATFVLFGCLSCESGRKPPFEGLVMRSEHFEHHAEAPEITCQTVMPLLESNLSLFEKVTGLHLTPPAFRYYQFAHYSGLQRYGCPSNCAIDDVVYASASFDAHELIHAYLFRAFGMTSVGLLSEGLASAFACDSAQMVIRIADWRNLVHLAETFEDLDLPDITERYAAAASFVSYLFYNFGWERLAMFYRSLRRGDDATAVGRAALSAFSVDMDTLWMDSLSSGNRHVCINDWTCSSSPLVLNEPVRQECDGEIHRSIEVSEPSTVGFYATEPVMLWDDCLAEPGPIFVLGQTLDPSIIWISLAAGKYNLTRISGNVSVFDPLSYPQDFSLRLVAQRPADFLASSCEGATTIPLDAQTKTNVRFPSTVSLSGWLRVGGPAESAFSVELDQFILEIPNYSGIHGEILLERMRVVKTFSR